ncbi:MAG: endonuclease/exonuclease/phosphatase family protein [Pseudobdellovibrionaceae bacterium]|nr:endonuclease/exonuclease/phosphatase family protein [Bdellovibrionales bacterium]USN47937.1 MAG: endonuclease/exonuclease/phosphatase family protein [Pseudobdellovibrionaceae bacterium]
MESSLRVLTYNMHKGHTTGGRRYVLQDIRDAIRALSADIVFLQEVNGRHPNVIIGNGGINTDHMSPLEAMADQLWPYHSYGKNAAYSNGHHGNAIMSKYPIVFSENIDISAAPFAKRGLLHAVVRPPEWSNDLHLICVHLDLFEMSRRQQLKMIIDRVNEHVDAHCPLLLAGDFNDWWQRATPTIRQELSLDEVFHSLMGRHMPTFPSWLPLLPLDRIYFRGLSPIRGHKVETSPWAQLSDHIPILAEFKL